LQFGDCDAASFAQQMAMMILDEVADALET
jgi:hypothetical protein